MSRLERKHSLATRTFHWINGPSLLVMLWSGLLIYWANDVYELKIGNRLLFHFFPDWFYKALHMQGRLGEGISLHLTFMWVFSINGLLYVTYTLASGEWRYLVPNRNSLAEAFQVVLHDLKIRKQPLPRRKFNGAQRIAYTGVVLMGGGSLLTGLAIYKPVGASWLTWALGGYEMARMEHFGLTIAYVFFFLVHITQVIRAGWNNARSMIIGVERADDGEPTYAEAERAEPATSATH